MIRDGRLGNRGRNPRILKPSFLTIYTLLRQRKRMDDISIDTDQIRSWRSIVTLIIFILTSSYQPARTNRHEFLEKPGPGHMNYANLIL